MESGSLALLLATWQCVGVLPSHAPSVQSTAFGFQMLIQSHVFVTKKSFHPY